MNPTPEQQSILDALSTHDNLMIRARPGTGKTATLIMIDQATKGPNLLLCFNLAIAKEAEKKVRGTTTVKTFNSLGHRVWAQACAGRLSLNKDKVLELFRLHVTEASKDLRSESWNRYELVAQGVNLARAIGYIPAGNASANKRLADQDDLAELLDEWPDALALHLIDTILNRSIKQAYDGIVDFNDQVYMPALFGGTYPKFPLVLVDEYQDVSPVNMAMLTKLCKNSRQIGVGDEAQAIYAFRGADSDSIGKAVTQFSMSSAPLSVSFRCPRKIVENVHWRAPDFRWSREGGTVSASHGIEQGSAVLCRNNAPLLAVAMKLLGQGHKVDVAGTDISARITRQMAKLGPEEMKRAAALTAVDTWLAQREERESKSAADTAECMRIFIRASSDLGQAIAYARHLFALSGTTRFLSGHKSKGLEFDHVYHLDPHLIREGGQDPNIKFVIDTRAKEHLTYINSHSMENHNGLT